MINIDIRKAFLDQIDVNYSTKRAVLDSLKLFWQRSESEYYAFLETIDIKYYENFNTLYELKEEVNKDIAKLNEFAESNQAYGFDFKTLSFLKSKVLKPIEETDFRQLHISLKEVSAEYKEKIKEIFIELKSVSLIDFMEMQDDYLNLYYHKKGAIFYNGEYYLGNSREHLNLLENFQIPKDNNFILARFLRDFSANLKKAGIDESFRVVYQNGTDNIKSIDEILYWAGLSKEEKQTQMQKLKDEKELQTQAQTLAKSEIKEQINQNRASLDKESTQEIIENTKEIPRIYNLKNNSKASFDEEKESKQDIKAMIAKSMELYYQKELEKTKIRLDKAQKDSSNAYDDLKECLRNGLSILEAIKSIQQKYRNDDTINFATLLFAEDILGLQQKDQEIKELQNLHLQKDEVIEALNEKLEKKDETISKLRSTMQTKINELQEIEYRLNEEHQKELNDIQAKMTQQITELSQENNQIVNEYEVEIKKIDIELKEVQNSKNQLEAKNQMLEMSLNQKQEALQKAESQLQNLQEINTKYQMSETMLNEAKSALEKSNDKIKDIYKLELQLQNSKEKEQEYKQQIQKLEAKLENLEVKLLESATKETHDNSSIKKTRSRDILG